MRSVGRDPSTRDDHVHVGMMRHRRTPSVQDCGDADLGAEVLGVGGNGQHGIRRGLEQQIVE